MRKAPYFLLLSLFCIGNSAFSQSKNNLIDSLEIVLIKNQERRVLANKKDYFKIDTTRVNTLNLLTYELIFKADLKKAEPLIREALEIANKVNFKRGLVNAYNYLGELYRRKSEYPLALQNLEKALKIAKEIGYKAGLGNTYNILAGVNNNTSNYPEAFKNNFAALKIREEINDRLGVAKSLNSLGNNYIKIGNNDEALNYYLKAFKIFKELNEVRFISNSYNNFGVIYKQRGNFKEALINYFEVVNFSLELNDRLGLANVYLNIGLTYFSMNDFEKSLDYNFKSLHINKAINNNFGVAKCYFYVANTYKCLNQLQLCRAYIDSSLRLSKSIGARLLIKDSYELISIVDSLEMDWKNAYHHYITYTKYNDSIINSENSDKIKQSQIQYELEKKDLEYQKLIALKAIQFEYQQKQAATSSEKERQKLKYEQKIKEQKLNFEYSKKITIAEVEQKQQLALNKILAKENNLMTQNSRNEVVIRWLMIFALLAFVTFGINYYKNYKRQKAANIIIAKQGEDLKALIHELNHRVKNNFQTVASMLSVQTRLLEDKTLAAILTQTSNRFLAISSVHEKFYQLESFSGLPIKDFLCDIVDNISHQFEVATDQFEYKITDNSELKTNIQTVLPLVLIVNELVTNTFKHAYSTNNGLAINICISHFKENKYQLIYSDNGPGLPPNFSKSNTFGLKLLKLFAEQLKGSIQFNNENGAVATLVFKYE